MAKSKKPRAAQSAAAADPAAGAGEAQELPSPTSPAVEPAGENGDKTATEPEVEAAGDAQEDAGVEHDQSISVPRDFAELLQHVETAATEAETSGHHAAGAQLRRLVTVLVDLREVVRHAEDHGHFGTAVLLAPFRSMVA